VVTVGELLSGTAREHIARMWSEHVKHLSPEGNTMGGGHIDPDEGVVCNCGEVLGFPTVQDEADYVAAVADEPDTSGAQTGEPDTEPDEPDWTEQQTQREQAPDPDSYQDPDMLKDLESQSAPGPLARSVQGKADTIEAIWNHLDTQAAVAEASRDAEMRERFGRNPHDPEARAWVYGHRDLTAPDEAQADSYGPDEPPWDEVPQGAWMAENPDSPPTHVPEQASDGRLKGVMPYRDPGVVEAQDPLAARVVVIDPSQPYTPQDVEQQLLDIEARLERGMHFQRYWEEAAYAAKMAYTIKAAKARQDAPGAKDQRDAYVLVRCEAEWREMELADAMVKSMRETMHTLRSLQSGYQTVSRSVSESMRGVRRYGA
jgi:hypothetical protein